jgi:hypothetical protein
MSQGRSGRVLKISPSPGFEPGTVQLYRLHYPGPRLIIIQVTFLVNMRSEQTLPSLSHWVNFSLEQAMKAQRGSRGIAVLFL